MTSVTPVGKPAEVKPVKKDLDSLLWDETANNVTKAHIAADMVVNDDGVVNISFSQVITPAMLHQTENGNVFVTVKCDPIDFVVRAVTPDGTERERTLTSYAPSLRVTFKMKK